jgi:uncharacterized membrane protein YphA (DoxX/SURF4 family)
MFDSLKEWRHVLADDASSSNDSRFDNSRQQSLGISGMILEAGRDDHPWNLGQPDWREAMKPLNITYWISTVVFAMVFATTGTMYLMRHPTIDTKFQEFGFPLCVISLLGIAKVLGVIALLVPKYPRLKEWAYAGFAFDLIGAMWSHLAVQGFGQGIRLLIPISVMVVSYVTYHRLHDTRAKDLMGYESGALDHLYG